MFPKLAQMTDSVWCLITMDKLIIPKDVDGRGSWMTQTVMSEVGGDGEMGLWCWWGSGEGVEVASTIAAKHHAAGRDILHRKTQCIKFNGTVVIPSKLANGKEIAHKGWNN